MFFEGPEKKVELIMAPGVRSLRSLGRGVWEDVVQKAGAKILSEMSNSRCDAYLLSESSLFVFDSKFILITCGQTVLTFAIMEFLSHIPAESVEMLFYERKNEMFPHSQRSGFLDEAVKLNRLLSGRAYQFGDHDGHHVNVFHLDRRLSPDLSDTTTQILMHGLGEAVRTAFYWGNDLDSESMRKRRDVSNLLEGFTIDERLFSPAGYSLNALKGESYYTIHVSPEVIGSYASIETNYDVTKEDGNNLLTRALDIFSPSSFDIVYYSPKRKYEVTFDNNGYALHKTVAQNLICGYTVFFKSYHKPGRAMEPAIELPLAESQKRGA